MIESAADRLTNHEEQIIDLFLFYYVPHYVQNSLFQEYAKQVIVKVSSQINIEQYAKDNRFWPNC